MSTAFISRKTRYNNAEQFKRNFSNEYNPTIGYVFIGNHIPYANETVADDVVYSEFNEKKIWDNMIAAKKIVGNSVELVIPRLTWTSNYTYHQYDDIVDPTILLTQTDSANVQPMYVINSENNVYKCVNNNLGQPSTDEPLGQAISSQGNVITADSYVWKYMYKVPEPSPFESTNWIPVPTSASKIQYSANTATAVDGELLTVVVTNPGTDYYNSEISVNVFPVACTRLTVSTGADLGSIKYKMGVSGTGIQGYTYITAIDAFNRYIDLSYPTDSSGGGSGNNIQVFTRTEIFGDGTGAVANTILANTGIYDIKLSSYGSGYNYANVVVYGTGTGVESRVILPPKYGHSFNSARELGAYSTMVNMYFGEIGTSEIISSNIAFRQYGILCDPHLYGSTTVVANASSVITQTTEVTVLSGTSQFSKNEFVYQGNINSPTFSGIVSEENSNIVYLTNVKGTISIPSVLKGANTNLSGRTTLSITYPEFEPYTGYILYTQNILPIQRDNEQFENIKFVVKF